MARRTNEFQTIHSEGGLLPADLLRRVLDPRSKLPGTRPEDYGLPEGERLNESITQGWNRLRRHWAEFQAAAANLPANEAGTGLTNEKWTLPVLRELGFGPLPTSPGPELNGRTYAINRFLGPVPIHLVGCNLSLDRRAAGVRGAAAANPHGLVQEFLNRSPAHLWALVSNGRRARLLRDSQALSRQSYLEFDLETMFTGEVYSDFVLLWLVAHQTRFTPREEGRPETCWLEQWTCEAQEQGTRALGDLRGGVERALQILGEGFTSHPRNSGLRDALRSGQVTLSDLHGQLLRVVYRLIFLFVAEDRILDGHPLLHPPDASDAGNLARERYARHYGTARLRDLAGRIKGSGHGDLWRGFQVVLRALSGEEAFAGTRAALALPALGSDLWSPGSTAALNEAELSNFDFLEALRNLSFTRQDKVLRPVDYRNLGAEELGGVYESLLALTPQISADGARFSFAEFAGSERKTSGSYYTPDSLVQCLLDSALDPVVEEALKGKTGAAAEEALLELKVCDPAVGSGHFLVGAAHRLARHLSRVRAMTQGEGEPSPLLYQQALRDVIGRCLYGVDLNPMAAELCRVGLWLEALEPGKPLSFLDHHIRVGNSLLGATPELLAGGLPDEAFTALEGDDKKACTALRKRNKAELTEMGDLFAQEDAEGRARLEAAAAALDLMPDDRPEAVRAKELAFRRHEETPEYRQKKQLADAWCAAFVFPKRFPPLASDPRFPSPDPEGITSAHLANLARGRALPAPLATGVEELARGYRFFHWHLAFPEVFARGGFDCVLGNPPWERIKIQEKEWFAQRDPEVAAAPNSAERKRRIQALQKTDPDLAAAFREALRRAEGESHLLRNSGRYPLCGRGDINTYAVFAELGTNLAGPDGRLGIVVPTGIATDDTTKSFFQWMVADEHIVSLLDFQSGPAFFCKIGHARFKFSLLTVQGNPNHGPAKYAFYLRTLEELADQTLRYHLSKADIQRLNPNTGTCPIFRSARDASINRAVYARVPVLVREGPPEENPWGISFMAMLHMANDSGLFRTAEQLEAEGWVLAGNRFRRSGDPGRGTAGGAEYLPLYEAKMLHHFDHRFGDYGDKSETSESTALPQVLEASLQDLNYAPLPRYWVPAAEVEGRLSGRWDRGWLLGWRDICRSTDERTVIASLVPRVGTGDTFLLGLPAYWQDGLAACLLANLSSFALDYCARQKVGGTHLKYHVFKQLPVLPPSAYQAPCPWSPGQTVGEWLLPRVLGLVYTAWDLAPFARDCGFEGPPFRWDAERRFHLRCELDAAFFHLYGIDRADTEYVLGTFPVTRKNEERDFGEFRTRRVVLEEYERLAAVRSPS